MATTLLWQPLQNGNRPIMAATPRWQPPYYGNLRPEVGVPPDQVAHDDVGGEQLPSDEELLRRKPAIYGNQTMNPRKPTTYGNQTTNPRKPAESCE